MIFDTHCHLNMMRDLSGVAYATRNATDSEIEEQIQRDKQNNILYIMQAGTFITEIDRQIDICKKFKDIKIFCSIANHPENVKTTGIVKAEQLIKIVKEHRLQNDYIKAIGETGLDTHREENLLFLDDQIKSFENHIQAGIELNLPIIIHAYGIEAIKRCIDMVIYIVKNTPFKFVFHCYDGTYEQAKQIIDFGGVISFSGTITFKKKTIAREILSKIPLEHIVIETDAPFLAPEPKRGQANEVSYIKYTAEYISNYLQIDYNKFCQQITENGLKLFNTF